MIFNTPFKKLKCVRACVCVCVLGVWVYWVCVCVCIGCVRVCVYWVCVCVCFGCLYCVCVYWVCKCVCECIGCVYVYVCVCVCVCVTSAVKPRYHCHTTRCESYATAQHKNLTTSNFQPYVTTWSVRNSHERLERAATPLGPLVAGLLKAQHSVTSHCRTAGPWRRR